MARCDLSIEFERGERTAEAGGSLKGLVRVRVEADAECQALTLTQEWRTHGKGNVDRRSGAPVTLFQGRWQAGEERTYPFVMPVPSGPVTYHGQYVNLDWYLKIRADIPWALDPKAEEEFLVVPAKDGGDFDLGPSWTPPKELAAGRENVWFGVGVLVFLAGCSIGGWLLWRAWSLAQGQIWDGLQPGLFGLAIVLIGCVIGYMSTHNALAQRTLGPVRVELPKRIVRRGEELSAGLSFAPRARGRIGGALLRLRCMEEAVSGSGTNKTTHSKELGQWIIAHEPARDLSPGMIVQLSGSVPIEINAAPTLAAGDNRVLWQVDAEVQIDNSPDWSRQFPIAVLP